LTHIRHWRSTIFIETSVFTRQVLELLTDEEYANFQSKLAANPLAGDVIKDTGGLRKVRVAAKGRGKRGGARVIYYHVSSAAQIRLLLIYAKGRKDDLSAHEKRVLRGLNERW
jgi:mRNA-degrading endonuclease RelE of RelBE toxin-antitoxin system